jgi:hypothetical protein
MTQLVKGHYSFFFRATMALYWHNRPHLPQPLHFAESTSGTPIVTLCVLKTLDPTLPVITASTSSSATFLPDILLALPATPTPVLHIRFLAIITKKNGGNNL